MRTTPPPMYPYEGLISDFVEAHVMPALPPAERLATWMEGILAYHEGNDPIAIVRGPRKGELRREAGQRIADSDNSPGIWCFLRARDGAFNPAHIGDAIEAGQVPVLAALAGADKRTWDWNYSKAPLARRDSSMVWDAGLKHCHLLPVLQETGLTPRQRAVRNLSPVNHFLFPNGQKHFSMGRCGWSDPRGGADLGESERVIAWVQYQLVDALGASHRRLHERFLIAAGGRIAAQRPPDGRIWIREASARGPAEAPSAPASPATASSARSSGTPRRWTMNSNLDYYVKTGEREPVLDLTLDYLHHDGRVETVGRFLLDLDALSRVGVVTSRQGLYDIKVVRVAATYWLGVRASPRLSLDTFRR